MHLAVDSNNPLEKLALATGLVPTPLVASFWGMGVCRCLIAGVRLGVFDALADGPRLTREVAAATACDPAGVETLLDALCGFGFLRRQGAAPGRYHLAAVARRWLLSGSRRSLRDMVLFAGDLWDRMGGLEDAVRTGSAERFHEGERSDEFWERYMRGLASMARVAAPEVVRLVRPAAAPTRLLDAGGGHGLFAAGFCRKYPGLSAEVMDLPGACRQGRAIIAEAGFADRVRHREGDLRQDDWGGGFDLVLLFNVLHNSTPAEAVDLLRRAHAALSPGGLVAVLDSEHRPRPGNPSATAGFNELFFFVINGTRAYPEATMREWLSAAGFGSLRTRRLLMMPEVLLLGTRPPG